MTNTYHRPGVPAEVRSLQSGCKLTFFLGRVAKNSGPNPRSFPENNADYPPRWAQKHVFTPNFRLRTVTTGSGLLTFDCSLLTFHLLTEIYPMVPSSPSVREGVSDYTSTPLRWTPLTSARATACPDTEPSQFVFCIKRENK